MKEVIKVEDKLVDRLERIEAELRRLDYEKQLELAKGDETTVILQEIQDPGYEFCALSICPDEECVTMTAEKVNWVLGKGVNAKEDTVTLFLSEEDVKKLISKLREALREHRKLKGEEE